MRIGLNTEKVVSIEDSRNLMLFKVIKQFVDNGSLLYSGSEVLISDEDRKLLEEEINKKTQDSKSENIASKKSTSDNRNDELNLDNHNYSKLYLFKKIAELVRDGQIKYLDGKIRPTSKQEQMIKEVDFPTESNCETLTIKGKTSFTKAEAEMKKIDIEKISEYSIVYIKSKNSTRK